MSTQGDKLKAIADAIRAKEGSSAPIVANDFPARIAAIETGTQLPTLTNPATANDMAQGKQLIDQNGEIVTGNLSVRSYSGGYPFYPQAKTFGGKLHVGFTAGMGIDVLLKAGPNNQEMYGEASSFGNATAADVAAGKTFTSAAGLAVTGTAVIPKTVLTTVYGGGGIALQIPYSQDNGDLPTALFIWRTDGIGSSGSVVYMISLLGNNATYATGSGRGMIEVNRGSYVGNKMSLLRIDQNNINAYLATGSGTQYIFENGATFQIFAA